LFYGQRFIVETRESILLALIGQLYPALSKGISALKVGEKGGVSVY
jgi:hypothetical protein